MRLSAPSAVVLALLVVACGGGSSSTPGPEPAHTMTSSTPNGTATTIPVAPAPAPTTTAPSKIDDTATDATAKADDAPTPVNAPPPATDADVQTDTKAANAFTLKMLARAREKNARANVMVSGTSLRQAFGAAYVGAQGTTAKEIATAFGFAEDPKKSAAAARSEIEGWQKARGQGAELSVANKIWVEKTMPVKPEFSALVAWAFGAPAQNVDFAKAPDEARRQVNTWVFERTNEKIKDLLPEGSVDAKTRAIIANAVYFKGKWFSPFPKDATKDEPFKLDAKKTVSVPTMHVTDQFRYAKVPGGKLVELRYVGNDMSLFVVVPDDANGLPKLEEGLTADVVDKWSSALQVTRVALSMPKFTFKWGGSVKKHLEELGVKTAFTPKADLSGMAMTPGDLMVSDVFHQTWVSVDEQGTEAAAATGMVVRLTSMPSGPITDVKIDRPFLFFVRGRGRILFAGRVMEPKI